MGFFKDFKEDLSQAVNELSEDAGKFADGDVVMDDDVMIDTLSEEDGEVTEADSEKSLAKVSMEADKEDAPSPKKKSAAQDKKAEAEAPAEEIPAEPVSEEKESDTADTPSDETAIITPGLAIKGDIQCEGSIELLGKVEGSVTCKGKLVVSGEIVGDSSSSEFFSDKAKVKGDIKCDGPAKIGSGSVIVGNLSATSAVIAGAIKGDIDVQGPVIVDTSAVVMGNIKSKLVQINNGAVIEGFCSQCYAENNPKKFFGEE